MQFTAAQIANLLNGQIEGDADATVTKLSKIEEGSPGSISFLANPLYTQYLYSSQASVIIIKNDFVLTGQVTATLIRVESPENSFSQLLEMYNLVKLNKKGISKLSFIADSAKVGTDIYAGEFSFVGENATIDEFQFVQFRNRLQSGLYANCLLQLECLRVDESQICTAVAEDQRMAVVCESPAFTELRVNVTITDVAFTLQCFDVVNQHVAVAPCELIHAVFPDCDAFAKNVVCIFLIAYGFAGFNLHQSQPRFLVLPRAFQQTSFIRDQTLTERRAVVRIRFDHHRFCHGRSRRFCRGLRHQKSRRCRQRSKTQHDKRHDGPP